MRDYQGALRKYNEFVDERTQRIEEKCQQIPSIILADKVIDEVALADQFPYLDTPELRRRIKIAIDTAIVEITKIHQEEENRKKAFIKTIKEMQEQEKESDKEKYNKRVSEVESYNASEKQKYLDYLQLNELKKQLDEAKREEQRLLRLDIEAGVRLSESFQKLCKEIASVPRAPLVIPELGGEISINDLAAFLSETMTNQIAEGKISATGLTAAISDRIKNFIEGRYPSFNQLSLEQQDKIINRIQEEFFNASYQMKSYDSFARDWIGKIRTEEDLAGSQRKREGLEVAVAQKENDDLAEKGSVTYENKQTTSTIVTSLKEKKLNSANDKVIPEEQNTTALGGKVSQSNPGVQLEVDNRSHEEPKNIPLDLEQKKRAEKILDKRDERKQIISENNELPRRGLK